MARVLVLGLAILAVFAVGDHFRNSYIPVPVAGGSYEGELPGYGVVQMDVYLGGDYPVGWLYREGLGLARWFSMRPDAAGRFHVELTGYADDLWQTNATLIFGIEDSGRALSGQIFLAKENSDRAFRLHRIFEHRLVSARSGVRVGSIGASRKFHGQFPVLSDPFGFAGKINERMEKEIRMAAKEFIKDELNHQWEAIQWWWPVTLSDWKCNHQWQVRLWQVNLASFAVWEWPDEGNCGNSTRWSGRNYWWSDGSLVEFNLADLLRPDRNWTEQLRVICLEDLRRQNASSSTNREASELNLSTFTVSPTGLQIYFNPYEVGCGAEGEFVVHIPYEKVKDFLRADGPAALLPIPSR